MNRLDAMLNRLPPAYTTAAGSLLRQFLALFANQLAAYDEDLNRVQRSHWIDTAFDRADLEKLGALFDIAAAPWEPEHLYRARLKATIAARLRGAVTRDVLEFVLVRILDGAQQALGVRYVDLADAGRTFQTGPQDRIGVPAFIEFPKIRRRDRALQDQRGLLKPLGKITVHNRGLHPVALQGVIRGVAGRLTVAPALINLTNGDVMIYVGLVRCGQEVRFTVRDEEDLAVRLDERDVSDRVYTKRGYRAGEPLVPAIPDGDPKPIRLELGENRLWFLPLALYDEETLGSGIFSSPRPDVEHGRFADKKKAELQGPGFDASLFEQPPAVSLDLWWDEDTPARFVFEIPAGIVLHNIEVAGEIHPNRARLFEMLNQTVDMLRAAAVDGLVVPTALPEQQDMRDRLRVLDPTATHDDMRMESRLKALSALFDQNAVDGSRFT